MISYRVYGVIVRGDNVALLREIINGIPVIKFPGGGIHKNETPLDALKRELMEELNISLPKIPYLFYVCVNPIQSYFSSERQVIASYYLYIINNNDIECDVMWYPIRRLRPSILSFYNDRQCARKLIKAFNEQRLLSVCLALPLSCHH